MDAKSQEDLKRAAQEKVEDFEEASEDIQGRISEIWDAGREKAGIYVKTADQKIRENPYQAVGIAFGLGLIVGLLLTRRSDD